MAVGRTDRANLLQVTWAVPGRALKPEPSDYGFVYPVRLRVTVMDSAGRPVASLDTTKQFLSSTPVPAGENLVDRVAIPVPPGRLTYRLAVQEGPTAGSILPDATLDVGSFDGSVFSLSSVVLGARNANLLWVRAPGDTIFFNPTAAFRRDREMELYYEVYGLPAGTGYKARSRSGAKATAAGRACSTVAGPRSASTSTSNRKGPPPTAAGVSCWTACARVLTSCA